MEETGQNGGAGLLFGKRAAFLSLGCKVNAYETQAMRELFEAAGAQTVDFEACADIFVVNTCTVTNIADRKSRQMLHRARKKNPAAVVVAAGCYVQAAEEDLKKELAVDILVGNNHKNAVVDLVVQFIKENIIPPARARGREGGNARAADCLDCGQAEKACSAATAREASGMGKLSAVSEISREKVYEELGIASAEKTRAYIKVQDGCNQFCSYCIIPFARGRIRSRSIGDVEEEVRRLAGQGYQEIVLTGIHLSSYGMEAYPEKERFALCLADEDMPLIRLIQSLDAVPGITRIRLGSLEPRIVTERFAAAVSGTKVCPHFHLSLQSGCDATLARMNRRYNTEKYRESCGILRRFFDRPAITTDVIVGFPGETQEEFQDTVRFVQNVKFAQMHVFKYSRRKGTRAAEMPGQVAEEIKARRSDAMLLLEKEMRQAYENSFAGEDTTVLFEEGILQDGISYMVGHNERYIKYAMRTQEDLSNLCIKGHISGDFAGEIPLIERKQSK